MKIAYITEYSEIGGGESNLIELAIEVSKLASVTVFCPKGKLFNLLKQHNIAVIELNMLLHKNWIKFIHFSFLYSNFNSDLKNFDIIHVYSLQALPLVFGSNTNIVWTCHGYWEKPYGLRARIIDLYIKLIFTVSHDIHNLSDFSVRKKRLVYLGTKSFDENVITRNYFDRSTVKILIIGRFQKIKGQDIALHAINELVSNEKINVQLTIVGDVNYSIKEDLKFKDTLVTLVTKYSSNKFIINMVGYQKDVSAFILDSDIVLIPSLYESFSMVAVESLARGIPVVAPSIGGPAEIVNDNRIGLLFKPGDIQHLKDTLTHAINNYGSFDYIKCIDRAKHFSIENQSRVLVSNYTEVISSSKKTSILYVISRIDIGGGTTHLLQLLSFFSKKYNLLIACPNDKPFFEMIDSEFECIKIPHRKFSILHLFYLYFFAKLRGIDIIHSHGKGGGIYARILGLLTGKKIVHTFHGVHYHNYSLINKYIYLLIEKFLSNFTDKFINVSESEWKQCVQGGLITSQRSEIIPNGVSVPPYKPRHIDIRSVTLISVARLSQEKGLNHMLLIMSQLLQVFTRFKLIIVGDGPEKDNLVSFANELSLSNHVNFLGFRNDIKDLLDRSDIFISTSLGEGLPYSILEAMAQSLPIVASNVPGNTDLINDDTGFLFDLEDYNHAVNLILKIIYKETSDTTRNAHDIVSHSYNEKILCERVDRIYENLTNDVSLSSYKS